MSLLAAAVWPSSAKNTYNKDVMLIGYSRLAQFSSKQLQQRCHADWLQASGPVQLKTATTKMSC